MMKRLLLFFLAMGLGAGALAAADENVRAAQSRLKEGGFYFRDVNGVYDSETAAAVTRYQIRHGLQISGKLDAPTVKALGIAASTSPQPRAEREGWPLLRKKDQEFLARQKAASPSPPPAAKSPPPSAETYRWSPAFDHERLRDYVGAFILAGLDPQVGAELEFFADRVDYFGERAVPREKIRRDLARYNERWPERRFWLDGDLSVEPQANDRLKVIFPLRFELAGGKRKSFGKVQKSLVLQEAGDDLEIVAVDEKKTR
jgi:hypothetical protein